MRVTILATLLMVWVPMSIAQRLDYPVYPVAFARLPSFTEGIVFDHEGNAFVSNARTVWRVTPDGTASVWVSLPGGSFGFPFNGHKVLGDDSHLLIDVGNQAIFHMDRNGKILRTISECEGLPLLVPNDLTLDPHGLGFYFTDSHMGIVCYVDNHWNTHWVTGGQSATQRVFYYQTYTNPKTGKTYDTSKARGYRIFNPNGIVMRPDGKTLLVFEADRYRILEYDVLAPGKVGPAKQFAFMPLPTVSDLNLGPEIPESYVQQAGRPDGGALDEDGNLYVTYHGTRQIVVFDKEGRVLRTLPAGNRGCSNLAFGGPNMDQLYITGTVGIEHNKGGVLFRLDLSGLGVHGLRILPPPSKGPWSE